MIIFGQKVKRHLLCNHHLYRHHQRQVIGHLSCTRWMIVLFVVNTADPRGSKIWIDKRQLLVAPEGSMTPVQSPLSPSRCLNPLTHQTSAVEEKGGNQRRSCFLRAFKISSDYENYEHLISRQMMGVIKMGHSFTSVWNELSRTVWYTCVYNECKTTQWICFSFFHQE